MTIYTNAILLTALVATNCTFASEERSIPKDAAPAEKPPPDYGGYRQYDPRVEPVPEDPPLAKAVEIEPLIRGLGVKLELGTEAPDFELPVLVVRENERNEKVGAIGNDTVRLSAFRGKKPVALTLSGST